MKYLFRFDEQHLLTDLHLEMSQENTVIKIEDKSRKLTYKFGHFSNSCEADFKKDNHYFECGNENFLLVIRFRPNDCYLLMEVSDLARSNNSTIFSTKDYINNVEVLRNNKVMEKEEILPAIYNDFVTYNSK